MSKNIMTSFKKFYIQDNTYINKYRVVYAEDENDIDCAENETIMTETAWVAYQGYYDENDDTADLPWGEYLELVGTTRTYPERKPRPDGWMLSFGSLVSSSFRKW